MKYAYLLINCCSFSLRFVMHKQRLLSVLTLLLIAVISINSFAQGQIPLDPSVRKGKLSNGLTYYIKYNARPEKRAELRLAVKAGSVLEDDDQKGLAHFCEHMAFNGTKSFPRQDLVNYVESIGMQFGPELNAYTSFDETVYMLRVPTDNKETLLKGMQIIEEWGTSILFEDKEIDKERGVILEEERIYRSAEQRISRKQMPVSFYNSKYAERDVIGDTNIIQNAPYAAFKRFYKDWYRPDLMSVIVVGDVNIDEIEKLIKDRFSVYNNPDISRKRVEYDMPFHNELLVSVETDKELSFPTVELAILHDEINPNDIKNSKELAIRQLANSLINRRLNEYLTKPNPPFQFSSVYYSRYLGNKDAFAGWAMAKGDNVSYAMEVLLTEIFRAAQHGFNDSELERVKTSNLRNYEKAVDEKDKSESNQIAMQLVYNFLEDSPYPGPEYIYTKAKELYPKISAADVNAAIKNMLKDNSVKILVSAPDREDAVIPKKNEIIALYNKLKNEKFEKYVDFVPDKPLFTKNVNPGKITKRNKNTELDFVELTMSNGATIYLKKTDFKNDEINFAASSFGGMSLLSDDYYHSAENAPEIFNSSGLGVYDNNQLRKYLSGKIAYVSVSMDDQRESLSGQASPKDIELFMQMIHMRFIEPRIDSSAFKAYMEKSVASLKDNMNNPESAFYDTMAVTMSNYHPRYGVQTLEKLNKVDLGKAYKCYKDRFNDASDFKFYFVGAFEFDIIEPLIEKYIGSLPSSNKKETWKDDGLTRPKDSFVKKIFKGTDYKSSVVYQYYAPYDFSYKNNIILNAMNEVLNIRLREVVREEKGGTYGAYAMVNGYNIPKGECRVYIGWGCSPDRVDELSQDVEKLIKEMQEKQLDETYVQKFKESAKREYETQSKTNYWWTYRIQRMIENGFDAKTMLSYMDIVNSITTKDIQEAAKKYLNISKFGKFVHYPESKL